MALVETSLSERSETERKADRLAVMLVMSCPCATVSAASTAITAAIANAARRQILVKGGRYVEQVTMEDVICLDKTGTVTTDVPRLPSRLATLLYLEPT
jgi:cation-transporting P-type ATPase C